MSETTEKTAGVTYWRKRPIVIPGVPWDGGNGEEVLAFTSNGDGRPRACIQNGSLAVWNDQERTWLPVPVGHVVMKGALGELYPVSGAALQETFDPADGSPAAKASDVADDLYAERLRVSELFAVLTEVFTCLAAGDPALLNDDQVGEWRERAAMDDL